MPDEGFPKTRLYSFSARGISKRFHESMVNEILQTVKWRAYTTYLCFDEEAPNWKQYSAALSHYIASSNEEIVFLVESTRSWVACDILRTARMARDMDTIVGAICSRKFFGAGFTSHWGEKENDTSMKGIPIGTNDDRAHEVDRVDGNFLAIPRTVLEKVWSRLNVNGGRFKGAIKEAMQTGDADTVHRLNMLSLSSSRATTGEHLIDFFRPVSWKNSNGTWSHFDGDFAFSERCKYCGVQPVINSHPVVSSWGEHGFTFHDALMPLDRTTGPKEG